MGSGAYGYGGDPQGYGSGQYGGGNGADNPFGGQGNTILTDGQNPGFIVEVFLRMPGPRPPQGRAMMGPMVPAMQYFWPLWETQGATVLDIIQGVVGTLGNGSAWADTPDGAGISDAAGGSIAVPVLQSLKAPLSMDRRYWLDGKSTHEVMTLDANQNIIHYVNGDVVADGGYGVSYGDGYGGSAQLDLMTTDLFLPFLNTPETPCTLEYMRYWNRVLTQDEVTALYQDPYLMFGVTPAVLDEITTVINFMKPALSAWHYVFSGDVDAYEAYLTNKVRGS